MRRIGRQRRARRLTAPGQGRSKSRHSEWGLAGRRRRRSPEHDGKPTGEGNPQSQRRCSCGFLVARRAEAPRNDKRRRGGAPRGKGTARARRPRTAPPGPPRRRCSRRRSSTRVPRISAASTNAATAVWPASERPRGAFLTSVTKASSRAAHWQDQERQLLGLDDARPRHGQEPLRAGGTPSPGRGTSAEQP